MRYFYFEIDTCIVRILINASILIASDGSDGEIIHNILEHTLVTYGPIVRDIF